MAGYLKIPLVAAKIGHLAHIFFERLQINHSVVAFGIVVTAEPGSDKPRLLRPCPKDQTACPEPWAIAAASSARTSAVIEVRGRKQRRPRTPLPCEVCKGNDTTPSACSLHASGHAATAPPSATSNCRHPMVTVIAARAQQSGRPWQIAFPQDDAGSAGSTKRYEAFRNGLKEPRLRGRRQYCHRSSAWQRYQGEPGRAVQGHDRKRRRRDRRRRHQYSAPRATDDEDPAGPRRPLTMGALRISVNPGSVRVRGGDAAIAVRQRAIVVVAEGQRPHPRASVRGS
jgi:hypothetical protein